MIARIFLLAFLLQAAYTQFLEVRGREFFFNGQRIHLSGPNIAWNSYGYDFGNGQYATNGPTLEQWIREIADAGGNSLSKCLKSLRTLGKLPANNYENL